MSTEPHHPMPVVLRLWPALYTAIIEQARNAGVSVDQFCRAACVAQLDDFGATHVGADQSEAGVVVEALFKATAGQLSAYLVLSDALWEAMISAGPELRRPGNERNVRPHVLVLCHDVCVYALEATTGVKNAATRGR